MRGRCEQCSEMDFLWQVVLKGYAVSAPLCYTCARDEMYEQVMKGGYHVTVMPAGVARILPRVAREITSELPYYRALPETLWQRVRLWLCG